MTDWSAFWLSIQVTFCGLAIAVAVGLPLAVLLALHRFPGRNLLEVLVTAPLVLPPTVLGYYVLVSVGRSSAIGRFWESLTGGPIVFSMTGCVLAATIAALPFVVKNSRSALEAVDPGLMEAAANLGAGFPRRLWTILLPLARRGIIGGCMLGFAKALGDFGVTLMVAGNIPGRTQTAPLAIYDHLLSGRDAQAQGLVLALTGLGILVLWLVNTWANPRPTDRRS